MFVFVGVWKLNKISVMNKRFTEIETKVGQKLGHSSCETDLISARLSHDGLLSRLGLVIIEETAKRK
jgi:hypothetical protein